MSVGATLSRTPGVANGKAGPLLGRSFAQPKVALMNSVADWLTKNSVSAASCPTRTKTFPSSTFSSIQASYSFVDGYASMPLTVKVSNVLLPVRPRPCSW